MERSVLETRIEQKAKARFEKEYDEFLKFCLNNKIARRLQIKNTSLNQTGLGDNDSPNVLTHNLPLFAMGDNYAILNGRINVIDRYKRLTNFEDVANGLVQEYIKEETENLLSKIDTLKDFFETALNQ